MQISITNGTLTQIQETLTASSGYTLPTTISVSGATSSYNSSTGAITLTNLTQTMSITAVGVLSVYTITIDGTQYSVNVGDSLLVNSTGLYNSTTSTQIFTFTPTTGRFFGFNTSSGQTTPSSNYEIGDTFTATQNLTLYSVEQLPAVTYDLDNLNLNVGTHTITAKAKGEGFQDSVASNSVSFTVTPSGYEVQITFQNGTYTNRWVSTEIYDNYILGEGAWDTQESGNKIGEILSANGTVTVTTTTGKICIKAHSTGYIGAGSSSTSQNITSIYSGQEWNWSLETVCSPIIVNSDGTITIDGIDWDF